MNQATTKNLVTVLKYTTHDMSEIWSRPESLGRESLLEELTMSEIMTNTPETMPSYGHYENLSPAYHNPSDNNMSYAAAMRYPTCYT